MSADAIRIKRIGDLPSGPEIQLSHGADVLVDGKSVIDWGDAFLGTASPRTITVTNIGTEPVILEDTITTPTGFKIITAIAATELQPQESTSFTIGLDGSTIGDYSGVLTLTSNDEDEGSFELSLSSHLITSRIIDNSDSNGFATTGRWAPYGGGRDGGYVYKNSTDGTARWTFDGVGDGLYEVAMTFVAWGGYLTNVPVTVLDDTTELTTISLNQTTTPNDFASDGSKWERIGVSHAISNGRLTVQIRGVGAMSADAVRIQRVGDLPAPSAAPPTPRSADIKSSTSDLDSSITRVARTPRAALSETDSTTAAPNHIVDAITAARPTTGQTNKPLQYVPYSAPDFDMLANSPSEPETRRRHVPSTDRNDSDSATVDLVQLHF